MKKSTFDVVVGSEWISRGSVVFPGKPANVRAYTDKELQAGYYPCAGVKFKAEPPANLGSASSGYTVFWWTGNSVEFLKGHKPPLDEPRKLTLKIIDNPSVSDAARVRQDINAFIKNDTRPETKDYTPHVRMDDDFVTAFGNLVFTEINHGLLRSDELELPWINVWKRDGSSGGQTAGKVTVFFEIRHIEDAHFGDVMMTTAKWSNGYVSLYGCCGVSA